MEISHQPCPHDDCSSSDAFSYNQDKGVGLCWSCGKSYSGKYPKGETEDTWEGDCVAEVKYIHEKGTKDVFAEYRGIKKSTMEFFNVKTTVSDSGEPLKQVYPYPSGGSKVRELPKKFYVQGSFKSDEFFGMNLFPAGCSKMVTIVEGELDAMSAWQMVQKPGYPYAVVSLPSASPAKAIWEKTRKWLNSFEKIILSVDNDGPGQEIARKINNMFPKKVYMVDHGDFKDANDFLQAGKAAEFKQAWWGHSRYKPENLLSTENDFLKLYDDTPDHTYVSTGISSLDDKILGWMQGHFTVIKAPTGIGKTEFMRYMENNFINNEVVFASWHLEESRLRSLLGLVSYHIGDDLTRKDVIERKGADGLVREAIKEITDRELYIQYYIDGDVSADDLIDEIRFLHSAYDCKYVLFEPIQDVISTGDEKRKESELASLSVRLSKLAADLNVGIITIAHTNENGDPKYCKMIAQRASVLIDLSRNKESEDELEINTMHINIEKNRPTSLEGHAGTMVFDLDTFTMKEGF